MEKKQLNQIILCSKMEHRSFLREIELVGGSAIVTHVEALPFRFHEMLAAHPVKDDAVNQLERAPIVPERHKGCPFCGNRTTYWCSCGTVSCKIVGTDRHWCPGCKAEHASSPISTSYASESGFVQDRLAKTSSAQLRDEDRQAAWQRSQSGLFNFMKRRPV
ncbi:MAG: hypothetical protein RIA64_08875 [Rhodospirillales bacterium]